MSARKYVAAQNGAVRLAVRDLEALWGRMRTWDALDQRKALEEAWPLLIAKYGDLAATIAADRFEDLTGLSAKLANLPDQEIVNARLRWGLDPLFGGAGAAAALGRLTVLADELVKQPGRDTMVISARKNKTRVARVPTGRHTCAFCLMLASRGAVYASKGSAGGVDRFHGKCDCRIEPVVDDSDLERLKAEGYDPDKLRDIYDANKATKGGSVDATGTLANIRADLGTN